MNIDSIDHFVITASDVEVICAFYKRVLGMRVREFSKGRKALYFGNQKINIHPHMGLRPTLRARQPEVGGSDFCLITKVPVAEVVQHLKAERVKIEAGPEQRSGAIGSITSVYFRDPDGNLVEVSNYD